MEALANIGLPLDTRILNCADYGDPTTRERWFGMAIAGCRNVPWPMPTHAKRADLFGAERWRTARDDVIDWSIRGKSIFDRKRPLAPKTIARIAAGIVKFRWPQLFIVVLRQHCEARGIDLPLPTITAGGTHLGLVQPFVLSQASGGAPRDVEEPLMAVPGGGAHALIAPYYGSGSGETCCSIDEPLPTATGKARFGLVMPVTHSYDGNRARSLDDPLPTITTAKRGEPAFITASFGERRTQATSAFGGPSYTDCMRGDRAHEPGHRRAGLRHPVPHARTT
jgi:DNA (cytosine-5)-methyltransferase 1